MTCGNEDGVNIGGRGNCTCPDVTDEEKGADRGRGTRCSDMPDDKEGVERTARGNGCPDVTEDGEGTDSGPGNSCPDVTDEVSGRGTGCVTGGLDAKMTGTKVDMVGRRG